MAGVSKSEPDPFRLLGVRPSASAEEIRRAFRRRAMEYHPDRNPDNAEADSHFREILKAYQTALRRAEQRRPPPSPAFKAAGVSRPRPHRTDGRRYGRRARRLITKFVNRFFLFLAVTMVVAFVVLAVIWSNTQTDWIPGCCWELFN